MSTTRARIAPILAPVGLDTVRLGFPWSQARRPAAVRRGGPTRSVVPGLVEYTSSQKTTREFRFFLEHERDHRCQAGSQFHSPASLSLPRPPDGGRRTLRLLTGAVYPGSRSTTEGTGGARRRRTVRGGLSLSHSPSHPFRDRSDVRVSEPSGPPGRLWQRRDTRGRSSKTGDRAR